MCDPITMTAMAAATSSAGAAATIGAVSAAYSAVQSVQQGNYQNKVAKYNARVTENEAQQTRNKGNEEENAQREATAQLLSKQRAQLGASGVELDSGSALQLQTDTERLGELDAGRIRSNTDYAVSSLEESARLQRADGKNAQRAGRTEAFTTILGQAASTLNSGVADKWFTKDSAAAKLPSMRSAYNR